MNIPFITVFIQGLLSFFSPCVLPLIPLYLAYLSGGAGSLNGSSGSTSGGAGSLNGSSGSASGAAGQLSGGSGTLSDDAGSSSESGDKAPARAARLRTFINTVFFVAGISFAFFVLGLGMSALGTFFRTNQMLFARIGGIIVAVFGLYQLGVLGRSGHLEKERRLPVRFDRMAMSPLTALLMGFVFSFAWTPCVGPTLSGVLLMAATAQTRAAGMLLIGVYTLGFIIPFLAVGLFTATLLSFFRRHSGIVRYTTKAGAVLLIALGLMMLTGKMNSITGYLSSVSTPAEASAEETAARQEETAQDKEAQNGADQSAAAGNEAASDETARNDAAGNEAASDETARNDAAGDEAASDGDAIPAPDFELYDQYGEKHSLADYRGRVVFLNFWATWCPPCRREMPDIQELYEKYNTEGSEVAVLGVAFPGIGGEGSEEDIARFLDENGYSYPVLMDTDAELMYSYGISAYPTTFMIDKEGNFFGYVAGAIPGDTMEDIIRQTLSGKMD